MLLVSLLSLVAVSFAMEITRRPLRTNDLELGPEFGLPLASEELIREADRLSKRGVDPMSIPRLVKEPPLKKRSDLSEKRGDAAVYPSASKHTVPLIRIREPPLKRQSLTLHDLAQEVSSKEDAYKYLQKRFSAPYSRFRYRTLREPTYVDW
ncbi:unnamed protein product [Caenorhabditis auriculariae]|uniref:Uncharacterized protein n=1 Tax=Caenorhabditis auriculariae TaxID=2777116 RepID=A0A8S1GWZ0_9PELO|nr:unnamed protein product [Caenorhabditis auriculariae]